MALDLGTLGLTLAVTGADKASKSIKDFGNDVGGTEGRIGGLTNKLANMVKGFAIGAVVKKGADAIVDVGKKALEAGANLQEMQNKFDVVFSQSSAQMAQWSEELGKSIGRSSTEIKTAISNQADLMIGMGMSEESAGSLAQSYTSLAYDLASFNNVQDSQAIEAMTKALMGETEMMKSLGVNLSETIMANSEFVIATGKSWKEMDMAEKAQMRLLEAQKQSVNALGDAERSADSYTNQQKKLKAELTTLYEVIGTQLIPIFTPVIAKVAEIVEVVTGLTSKFFSAKEETGNWIEALKATFPDMAEFIDKVVEVATELYKKFKDAFDSVKRLLEVFIGVCVSLWDKYGEDIIAVIKPMLDFVGKLFQTAYDLFMNLTYVFTALFSGDWDGVAEEVVWLVDTMWENIKELFSSFINFVGEFAKKLIPSMINLGKDMLNGLWEGLKGVWDGISFWVGQKVEWLMDKLTFWDNGQKKMSDTSSVKGSYANGIDYIPFDMPVMVHKGERILTAEENARGSFGSADVENLLRELIQVTKNQPLDVIRFNRMGVV